MEHKFFADKIFVALLLVSTCTFLVVHASGSKKTCKDFKKREVKHGESFQPFEDPCLKCQCDNGNQDACMSAMCAKPTCDNFIRDPENCCQYTCPKKRERESVIKESVKDIEASYRRHKKFTEKRGKKNESKPCVDDQGNTILPGQRYVSKQDPCISCVCVAGRGVLCSAVMCALPTCTDWDPVPGKCCEYECKSKGPGALNSTLIGGGHSGNGSSKCKDHKGRVVQEGQQFVSTPDPCIECVCVKGAAQRCMAVACAKPHCPYYVPKPDECCGYDCVDPIKPIPNDCEQYMAIFTEQAKYWLNTLKDEQGLWHKDILPAAVSAMQVTNPHWVNETDLNRLNVLKLHNLILSELSWSKEARSLPTQTLSDYVLAVKAVCHNPGRFYGHNLLAYLEKSVEKGLSRQNLYSLSGQVLTLCASGRTVKRKFVKKMKQLLNRNKYMMELGSSSMATLAYLCVQEQGQRVSRELRTTLHLTGQNFRPTDNHAALAVQALLIGGRSLDCRSVRAVATHLTKEIQRQNHNYTLSLGIHVAEMAPVLYDKTLLSIRDLCTLNVE